MIANLTHANEVQDAINKGARTLKVICRRTHRHPEQVSDALAYLVITAGTVRSEIQGNLRLYFPKPRRRGRFDDAPLSFSVLRGLMPTPRAFKG